MMKIASGHSSVVLIKSPNVKSKPHRIIKRQFLRSHTIANCMLCLNAEEETRREAVNVVNTKRKGLRYI